MDEVGGNINQKSVRNMRAQFQMCEIGTILQQKVSSKDNHYNGIGLTALTGKPVMCTMICVGKKRNVV